MYTYKHGKVVLQQTQRHTDLQVVKLVCEMCKKKKMSQHDTNGLKHVESSAVSNNNDDKKEAATTKTSSLI